MRLFMSPHSAHTHTHGSPRLLQHLPSRLAIAIALFGVVLRVAENADGSLPATGPDGSKHVELEIAVAQGNDLSTELVALANHAVQIDGEQVRLHGLQQGRETIDVRVAVVPSAIVYDCYRAGHLDAGVAGVGGGVHHRAADPLHLRWTLTAVDHPTDRASQQGGAGAHREDGGRLLENFAPAMRDHIGPHGFGGANGLLAMLQTRHAHLHGTRRDQLAHLCVTQREHALLNPNALFDRPLSVEQVLAARPIAEPFHLFDCVMPCSGAEAVLVVSEDLSRELGRPPVRLRAMREIHNSAPDELSSLDPGWRTVGDELWAETGYGPQDVDLADGRVYPVEPLR